MRRTGGAGEVPGEHGFVVEREVDDRIGFGRGLAQPVWIGEVAPTHLGPQGLDGGGRGVGPGEAGDFMSGLNQFGDDGRADVAAGTGDEDTHGQLSWDRMPRLGRQELCDLVTSR